MVRVAVAIGVLMLALPVQAAQDDAEEATRAYFEVLQSEGMSAIAGFMHPEELARFKEMLLPVYEAEARAGDSELRTATFGPSSTLETVRAATPETFMRRFGILIGAQLETVVFESIEVLGSVPEGNDVHVVVRTTVQADEVSVTAMEVVSWRVHENAWRALLTGEMEGLARQLQVQFGP